MAVTLTARPRTETGKGAARRLRRAGEVPAVIYGHGDQTRSLVVNGHELEKLLSSISVENTIIDLQLEGGETTPTLIREVQYHPVKPLVLHLDLLQVHAGEKLHLEVPIRLHGTPVGVRDLGGVLQEVLREIHVECLPADIPEGVDIDINGLGIGDTVHVSDVSLPKARILNDPDLVICTVTPPTAAALPEGTESEDTAGGDLQPELVRSRKDDADVPADNG